MKVSALGVAAAEGGWGVKEIANLSMPKSHGLLRPMPTPCPTIVFINSLPVTYNSFVPVRASPTKSAFETYIIPRQRCPFAGKRAMHLHMAVM